MTSGGKLFFARRGDDVFIRIEGRGTHLLAPDLDHFLTQLCTQGGFAAMVVDLTAATALDSTMLGLLARIGKWMRQHRGRAATLLCPSEKIAACIRGVGLDRLLDVIDCREAAQGEFSELPATEASLSDRARTVLAAHRELMSLNEANASAFRSVVEFLEQDLKRSG